VIRRLILCLDGTWNTADSQEITNIVRIRDLIAPKVERPTGAEEQRIHYHTGVGTGLSTRDKLIGGSTGSGLGHNVRSAYKYVSQHYEDGMEIYLFGFSRGAFTARSLAAYIGASGLLKADCCSRENEERAWRYYRTPPDDRFPSEYDALKKLSHQNVRIRLLGVFDTVGALGVPLGLFGSWNRRRFQFHDVTLGSNIDYAFHALAIDEKRGPFKPSLWQLPNHQDFKYVEQVWFPGVHSNIGGSYADRGLSDRALFWMMSRIERHKVGLTFFADWKDAMKPDLDGKLYDSRTAAYLWSRYRPMIRAINQRPPRQPGGGRIASLPRYAIPIGEAVDYTALWRWQSSETSNKKIEPYRPINLEAALDDTFKPNLPRPIPIVDEYGEPYNWLKKENDRKRLKTILPEKYRDLCDKTVEDWKEVDEDQSSEFWNSSQEPRIRISQRVARSYG
jgi:hypothetical protein